MRPNPVLAAQAPVYWTPITKAITEDTPDEVPRAAGGKRAVLHALDQAVVCIEPSGPGGAFRTLVGAALVPLMRGAHLALACDAPWSWQRFDNYDMSNMI